MGHLSEQETEPVKDGCRIGASMANVTEVVPGDATNIHPDLPGSVGLKSSFCIVMLLYSCSSYLSSFFPIFKG